jgi:hypothetical protein
MTVKEETLKLTSRQREGRAINAVAELLRRKLSGAGDLHAVEIKLESGLNPIEGRLGKPSTPKDLNEVYATWYQKYCEKLQGIHRQVMSMPAHYKYLAIPVESFDLAIGELMHFGLFPEDGIGRLGIITIMDKGEQSPIAEMAVAPERFRVDPIKLKSIETKLLAKNRPDIEVRI